MPNDSFFYDPLTKPKAIMFNSKFIILVTMQWLAKIHILHDRPNIFIYL